MRQRFDRRDFLQVGAAAAAGGLLARCAGTARGPEMPPSAERTTTRPEPMTEPEPTIATLDPPVVLATWDHGLAAARRAMEVLEGGGGRLDAICEGVGKSENDPEVQSVGFGGLPNSEGVVQLDACIMDGPPARGGAVGCLERIRNPIRVARLVMEETWHVFLVGPEALAFAKEHGFREEDLLTPASRRRFEEWRASQAEEARARPSPRGHDTISLLVMDRERHLAGGCSTSGLAWKLPGRVGDSPILGGGLFVDEEVGAAGATGVGEEVMQTCGSFLVVERMRAGRTPDEACRDAAERILEKHPAFDKQVAFLALRKDGAVGAWSIRPGFKWAVAHGAVSEIKEAPSIVEA